MKILCIDDNKEITKLLEQILTTEKHEFTASNDGKEGLELMRQSNFDVIFLDISMPNFSGFDLIDKIVEEGNIDKYNIVILTATSMDSEKIENLLKLGIKGHLEKPVTINDLFSVLKKFE
ncbi:MAG: response regulator [Thaumarchaeota archaeon]|nr:response regulator [Nitrososphaerota archaeon]